MDAVLTGKGISVAYQQNIIIPSMDVEISRGCVTSVIGPNGCGKSTLLKALSRMLPVRSGQVLLDGGMIARMPAAEVAKQMAILPQGPQAPGGLTVAELVAYGRYPHQKGFGRLRKEDYEAIDRALEMTHMEEFAERDIDALSGEMCIRDRDGSADGNFLAWHDDHVIQMFRRHLDVVDPIGGASGKAGGTASCQHEIRAVGQDTLIYNRGEITGGKL